MRVVMAAEQTWLYAAVECVCRIGSLGTEIGSPFWRKGQKIPDEAPFCSFWSVIRAQTQEWRGELHSLHSETNLHEIDQKEGKVYIKR